MIRASVGEILCMKTIILGTQMTLTAFIVRITSTKNILSLPFGRLKAFKLSR